jgi:DNA-binding transcriptional LysR family regulator
VLFRAPVRHQPVMSPDHPLAGYDEISIDNLITYPLALPNRTFGVRRAFDARLNALGLRLDDSTFTTHSLAMQLELATQGSAVLILPRMTVTRMIDANCLISRPFRQQDRITSMLELSHAIAQPQSMASRKLRDFLVEFLKRQLPDGDRPDAG